MVHREEGGGRVRAVFPDHETARTAITSLEHRGLDASTVRFDEDTRERTSESPQAGHRDERFLAQAGSRWRTGLIVGALAGAVIGVVVGIAFFEGQTVALAALAFAIGLGAAGAGLGVFAGGVWGQEQSATWEETFEAPQAGPVTLLVDVASAEELSLASAVLQEYSEDVQVSDEGVR